MVNSRDELILQAFELLSAKICENIVGKIGFDCRKFY